MSSTGLSGAAGVRNARYYTNAFNEFENASGAWRPSWNWGALICSSGWFFYRRMFVYGAINLALLLIVALPFTAHLTPEESAIAQGVLWCYVLAAFVVVPLVANWLYYRHLKRRLDAGANTAPDMLSFGAAAAAATVAAVVSMLALVLGTATGYEVRVHVADALFAAAPQKTAVENFIKQKGVAPATQTEAAALMPALTSAARERAHAGLKLVDILPGGTLRVAFAGYRHINGRSVELVPDASEKGIEWRCYNVDMPERELPAACRAKRPAERKAPVFKKVQAAKPAEPAGPAIAPESMMATPAVSAAPAATADAPGVPVK